MYLYYNLQADEMLGRYQGKNKNSPHVSKIPKD